MYVCIMYNMYIYIIYMYAYARHTKRYNVQILYTDRLDFINMELHAFVVRRYIGVNKDVRGRPVSNFRGSPCNRIAMGVIRSGTGSIKADRNGVKHRTMKRQRRRRRCWRRSKRPRKRSTAVRPHPAVRACTWLPCYPM